MSQLTTGLNSVSSFSGVPSGLGSISVEASVGETGIFVYGTNIQVYLADSSVGTWSDSGASFSTTDHEGVLIPWSGNDRMYIRDLSGSTPSVHVVPRSDSTSVPTLSAFISSIEGLSDVPDYDSSDASKYLAVNSGGTAIEFVDAPSGGGGSVTYNTTDYFIVEHSQHLTSGSGTLLMNSSNLYSGSAPVLSSNEPGSDAGTTLTVGAISIPSGSRIVGAEWRVLEAFGSSSSSWQAYGAIDFGDGKKFMPEGRYDVEGAINTVADSVYSGNLYQIVSQSSTPQDFSSIGVVDENGTAVSATAPAGTVFKATGSTSSLNEGVVLHLLDSSSGIQNGYTIEFVQDGSFWYQEGYGWPATYTEVSFQDIGAPEGISSGETFTADLSGLSGSPYSVSPIHPGTYAWHSAAYKVWSSVGGVFSSESSGNFGPQLLNSTGASVQGYISFPSYVPSVSGDIVPKLCWGAGYSGGTISAPASGMLAIRFVYI